MFNIFRINVMLIVLTMLCTFFLYGQQGLTPEMREQMAKADSEYAARSSDEKKILTDFLFKLLRKAEAADASVKDQQEIKKMLSIKSPLIADSKERIMVQLGISSRDAVFSVSKVINSLDGEIVSAGRNIGYIICRIHIKTLRKLISLSSVVSIKIVPGPEYRTITSAGFSQLKADSVQLQYVAYGDGVKVGVISDGVDNWTNARDNYELDQITVLNPGTGNEGTAILEIVHDLAPHASLYFYSGGYSYLEFSQAIKSLDSIGCKIIVDDIGFQDEPYFTDEDDTLGASIRNFIWHGGVFVSAAGNYNRSVNNDPAGYSIYSGITNIGADNYNIFANGQTFLDFTVKPNSFQLIDFEWATSWKHPTSDYDLYIYDQNGLLLQSSLIRQSLSGNNPPREELFFYNPESYAQVYKVYIKYYSGDYASVDYKIKCNAKFGIMDNSSSDNKLIYGHPGYPNVIGVAAYDAETPNQLAVYSSGGPLKMYSTDLNQWTIQQTPFITATSGVKTFVGSQGYWKYQDGTNVDPFYGTSAAAPHIAAIAALYFSQFNTRARNDFITDLKNSAVPIEGKGGNGNWDSRAGYGKANALACFVQASGNVATPVFNPMPQGEYTNYVDVTITCGTQQSEIRYATNGTEPTTSSALYSSPVHLTSTTTLKAKAFKSGLQPSSTLSATYQFAVGTRIVQVDTQGVAFDTVQTWVPTWGWWDDVPIGTIITSNYNNYTVSSNQDFIPGTNQKFNRWIANYNDNNPYVLNPVTISINYGQNNNLVAHFECSYNATIKAQLTESGNIGDSIYFKDPWLIDIVYPPWANHAGNQGMNAPFKPVAYLQNNLGTGTLHKGIFLNQSPNSNYPNKPYYSIRAPLSQTINGYTGLFYNWDTNGATLQQIDGNPSGYDQKAVIFNSDGATVTANYKGVHISGNTGAFANNSQRKVTRTTDGIMHLVYESMGHVWYETSSDNGATWTLANGGMPLDTYGAKLPAIDSYGIYVGIVWQEKSGGAAEIQVACGVGYAIFSGYPKNVFVDNDQSYDNDLNPVIAYSYDGRAVVAWENKDSFVYTAGIVAKFGFLNQFTDLGSPTWNGEDTQVIPSTTASSMHPTIASCKNPNDQVNMHYQIAWEQYPVINYSLVTVNGTNIMNFSSVQNISSGSYTYNYNPSIIAAPDSTARVVWKGQYYPGSSSVVVFREPDYYRFWYFGNNTRTPQITLADNNNGYYIIWNEVSDNSTKFSDAYSLSTIYNLNTTGQAVQLCNGTDRNSMYAATFTNTALPYFFTTTPSIGSLDMHKAAYS